MKQITVYGLLGKIYNNNEDLPKKIKYKGYEYSWHGKEQGYCRSVILSNWISLTTDFNILDILNDEVEIIEENNKIEKLTEIQNDDFLELPDTHDIMNKINQIIDVINEMKHEN